jgi:hypothetical protein
VQEGFNLPQEVSRIEATGSAVDSSEPWAICQIVVGGTTIASPALYEISSVIFPLGYSCKPHHFEGTAIGGSTRNGFIRVVEIESLERLQEKEDQTGGSVFAPDVPEKIPYAIRLIRLAPEKSARWKVPDCPT